MPAFFLSLLLVSSVTNYGGKDRSADEIRFGIQVAKKGLWTEAQFRFQKAAAMDPQNASAFNNLAIAYEEQGIFDKAREAYETALKLKPGNNYIQQNYDLFREADDKRNRKAKAPKKP
jgi:Flp pilus assembly protein TadD